MVYNYKLPGSVKGLVFVAVILTFFVRPFALGLDHSILSNGSLLAISLLISLLTKPSLYNRKKIFTVLFVIYLVFGLYMTLYGGDTMAVVSVLQLVSVYFLFQDYRVMRLFFKYIKNVFLILIILAIVNFILEVNTGNRESLALIKNITYSGTYDFTLYFPLTWSSMGWGNFGNNISVDSLSRQYYFLVEPGMAPPFFTAFIIMIWNDETERNKWLQTILFIVGIFLTFSTGGPLILVLSLSIWYFSKKREHFSFFVLIFFTAGLAAAWYAYNYMPFFGRAAKVVYTAGTAESVETHENISQNIIIGTGLLISYGLLSLKLKQDKVVPIVLTAIVVLGYMSNYIGYTTLATMLLFWDSRSVSPLQTYSKKNKIAL